MLVKDSPQVTPDHSTLTSKIWMEEIQDMAIVVDMVGMQEVVDEGMMDSLMLVSFIALTNAQMQLPNVERDKLHCTYYGRNRYSQETCWDLVSRPPHITRAYSAELENSVLSHNTYSAQQKVSILPKTFPLNKPPLCQVLHFQ